MKKYLLSLGSLLILLIPNSAQCAIIPTLFSTGVDSSGNPLSVGSIDPHYQLIAYPSGSGYSSSSFVADTSQPPLDTAWVSPGTSARWIGPTTDVINMPSATTTGDYIYETTFDLTGFDHTSAVITGQWTTDDTGPQILLNGVDTGFSITGTGAFSILHNFTLNSGFQSGLNTLQFKVNNAVVTNLTNPSGLLVIMTGTATLVPEPSAIVSLIGGTILALSYRRRMQRVPSPSE